MSQDPPAQPQSFMDHSPFVDSPNHIVHAGIQRQFHQPCLVIICQGLSFGIFSGAVRADGVDAAAFDVFWHTSVEALAAQYVGEQVHQAANSSGFPCPSRTDQEHTPNTGVDHGQEQPQLHLPLPDQSQEGERQRLRQACIFCLGRQRQAAA